MEIGLAEMIDTQNSWGCEFVEDNGNVKDFVHSKKSVIHLPMSIIKLCRNNNRTKEIICTEKDFLLELQSSIRSEGLRVPGLLYLDDKGRITLADGHHRSIALENLGHDFMPCEIKKTDQLIKKYYISTQDMVMEYLNINYGR